MKFEEIELERLNAAAYNPRRISPEARRLLKRSLETFGVVQPLLINSRGFVVVAGHQRLAILRELGRKTAPCVLVDLEPERERLLNVALNNPKLGGEFDFAKTADLLLDLDALDLDVSLTGFETAELQAMAEWTPPEGKSGVVRRCPTCGK